VEKVAHHYQDDSENNHYNHLIVARSAGSLWPKSDVRQVEYSGGASKAQHTLTAAAHPPRAHPRRPRHRRRQSTRDALPRAVLASTALTGQITAEPARTGRGGTKRDRSVSVHNKEAGLTALRS
jgi:hypothetical protein